MKIDRREFVKDCGAGCVSVLGLSFLVAACKPVKQINTIASNNTVTIPLTEFITGSEKPRKQLLIRTSELPFPIAVYRHGENNYSALLLQCTHQGVELSMNGNILTCPAHGSEFDTHGVILQGPAEQGLKNYKITSDSKNIFIHLT